MGEATRYVPLRKQTNRTHTHDRHDTDTGFTTHMDTYTTNTYTHARPCKMKNTDFFSTECFVSINWKNKTEYSSLEGTPNKQTERKKTPASPKTPTVNADWQQ